MSPNAASISTARTYSPRCQSAMRRSTLASTGPFVLPAARPSISASSASRSALSTSPTVSAACASPQRDVPGVERIADGLGPPRERADLGLHAVDVAALESGDEPQPPAEQLERPVGRGLGDGDDLGGLGIALGHVRRAGDRVAVRGEASSEGEAVLARPGERHGLLGELEASCRRGRQRERHRQSGQHVGAPGEHRRAGEGAGGLLEQIDLTLFEQPNLEAGEVGAEAESGTRQDLGRAVRPADARRAQSKVRPAPAWSPASSSARPRPARASARVSTFGDATDSARS